MSLQSVGDIHLHILVSRKLNMSPVVRQMHFSGSKRSSSTNRDKILLRLSLLRLTYNILYEMIMHKNAEKVLHIPFFYQILFRLNSLMSSLYHFQIYFAIMKINFAIMKIDFALMKINFALMKINFALMKINFALMKINFALMKINFALMKINFALMKINFALMKIDFALMKINFAIIKIDFAKMKINIALIEIYQLYTNENLFIIQKKSRQ